MKRQIVLLLIAALSGWTALEPVKAASSFREAYSRLGVVYPREVRQAPEFELKNLDGQTVRLSDFRGRPVLLNFWATWCQPCAEELPSLQRLHESLGEKGLQVVAISIDRSNHEKVRDYVKNYHLTFPVLLDPDQEARRKYFILGLPTSYLIDARGRFRGFVSGAREWDSEASKTVMRILLANAFDGEP